jgi:hypothetical protein
VKERAKELEQRVKSMSGKVDRNAISKLEKDEKQEASAKSMLGQVLKDKEKIEETIKELDRCKREALEKTWEKVNGYNCLACQLSAVFNPHRQRLWRYFRRAAAWELCEAAATRRPGPDPGPGGQSAPGQRVEAKLDRA